MTINGVSVLQPPRCISGFDAGVLPSVFDPSPPARKAPTHTSCSRGSRLIDGDEVDTIALNALPTRQPISIRMNLAWSVIPGEASRPDAACDRH
jgi:hypothetical protein